MSCQSVSSPYSIPNNGKVGSPLDGRAPKYTGLCGSVISTNAVPRNRPMMANSLADSLSVQPQISFAFFFLPGLFMLAFSSSRSSIERRFTLLQGYPPAWPFLHSADVAPFSERGEYSDAFSAKSAPTNFGCGGILSFFRPWQSLCRLTRSGTIEGPVSSEETYGIDTDAKRRLEKTHALLGFVFNRRCAPPSARLYVPKRPIVRKIG
mmetsp:Transcript_30157/g.59706  ORF Transcript_30157/g.59706 Transcript_30157/m.59706 type:complete len:208 (-) Transcript_30157:161-784(-)